MSGRRAAGDRVRRVAGSLRLVRRVRRLQVERDRLRAQVLELRELHRENGIRGESMVAELHRLRGDRQPDPPTAAVRHVFVFGCGRSGSTLLQGILCGSPGVLIRGENRGLVGLLYDFHRRALAERDYQAKPQPTGFQSPWFGMDGYPADASLHGLAGLITDTLLRPTPDARIVGFKEIRWPEGELVEFLDFLTALFPGARFIVNTRDLDKVARSGWWAKDPQAREKLEAKERELIAALDVLGDRAFRVHYDEYVADPGSLRALFDWLGQPFDEDAVRRTLARRHSYEAVPGRASTRRSTGTGG